MILHKHTYPPTRKARESFIGLNSFQIRFTSLNVILYSNTA